jgi:hypothetical protein
VFVLKTRGQRNDDEIAARKIRSLSVIKEFSYAQLVMSKLIYLTRVVL